MIESHIIYVLGEMTDGYSAVMSRKMPTVLDFIVMEWILPHSDSGIAYTTFGVV